MPSKLRTNRIADRIKQLLSEMLITGKISDPRLASVYITDVTVVNLMRFSLDWSMQAGIFAVL